MSTTFETEVLFRPEDVRLRYLPEGPYPCGSNRFSWVAIQHSSESRVGSLNVFDFASRTNETFELPGRPGFAFPTDRENTFFIGLERRLGTFDIESRQWTAMSEEVDAHVDGTIINDGVAFDDGIVFGTKDLTFQEPKAGLYLWRRSDQALLPLRSDQTCSNGKVIVERDGQITLIDIDSPTKTIVRYDLTVDDGTVGDPEIVVDLRAGDVFPDGMVMTPDGNGLIVAFYNPADAEFGEARQYGIESGELEAVWRTEKSPQVTCPQLVLIDESVKLVLTTAIENMPADRLDRHPNAGCLFIGDTSFNECARTPIARLP